MEAGIISSRAIENERVHEYKVLQRVPAYKSKLDGLKSSLSNYTYPFAYGFRVGLLFGGIFGLYYGIFKFIRTKNPYYIPVSCFIYAGCFGFGNSIFYLVRA